jgi:hypothetical protein
MSQFVCQSTSNTDHIHILVFRISGEVKHIAIQFSPEPLGAGEMNFNKPYFETAVGGAFNATIYQDSQV